MSTKLTIAQLKKLQASPAAFRSVLRIDVDGTQRLLSEVIEPWQKADFEKLDSGLLAVIGAKVTNPTLRFYAERARGHSKSSDLSIAVAYLMFASARPLSGILAAVDADQAAIVKEAVSRLIAANDWLSDFVKVQATAIVNPHVAGSVCRVITSDAPSSYGALPSFVIYDELAHSAKRDLFDSLLSAAAKKERCLFAVISNAGFQDSWAWTVREQVRTDPAWYFSRLDGPKASWITPERLAEQRRMLPDVTYRRLWLNEWSGGSGDAIHPDDLTAAVTQLGPMDGKETGWSFVAGLDVGISHDATALIVLGVHVGHDETIDAPKRKIAPINRALVDCGMLTPRRNEDQPQHIHHPGTGRIRVAAVQLWQPRDGSRVDLSEVEAAIVAANGRFNLSCVACDPWQSEMMIQRCQRRGLSVYALQQTGIGLQAQASAVLDSFRSRTIDLFPHDALLSDLRSTRVADRSYGFRLISPKVSNTATHQTAHGDCATAFAIALLAAKRAALRPSREIQGRLNCWPEAVA